MIVTRLLVYADDTKKKKVLPKKIPPFKMGRNWYLFDENGLAVSMMLVLFYLS